MSFLAEVAHATNGHANSCNGHMSCHWRLPERSGTKGQYATTVDMVIHQKDSTVDLNGLASWFSVDIDPRQAPNAMVAELFSTSVTSSQFIAFKIILPYREGYWCRRSIIQHRFRDSRAKSVKDFAEARQYYRAPNLKALTAASLLDLLATAVGAIELHVVDSVTALEQELAVLEGEVLNRLSLPLLLPDPIPRYRIAVIHGRNDWMRMEGMYRAAQEMDLDVYVLAEQGHWMQDAQYSSFRKAFIPTDIRVDDSLPNRLVETLRNYPVHMDGIVSFSDKWLIPVSYAAQALGLRTESPSVFETCRDKYLSRMIDVPEDFQCVRVNGYKGAKDFLDDVHRTGELAYPLVVKPCSGVASEGVRKVFNETELLGAAAKANVVDYGRGDLITIETYINGPEVDANFVIWEGAPLFFEISDQFPAEADRDNATSKSNFLETELFLPSALPPHEQVVIRDSMLRILAKLGCRNGIFHMEARMRNSSMEYRISGGSVDLVHKTQKSPGNLECLLIENNCRPPGTNSNAAIAHTYGVDFFALNWLIALGDGARARALSVPFLSGSQYHCDLVSIPVTKGGIFASTDATGDLLSRFPKLRGKIVKCGCYYKHGDEVPDPNSGIHTFIAFFMVVSRSSRKDVRDAAQQIRKEFKYTVVSSRDDLTTLDGIRE